jgi:hypothetical protein
MSEREKNRVSVSEKSRWLSEFSIASYTHIIQHNISKGHRNTRNRRGCVLASKYGSDPPAFALLEARAGLQSKIFMICHIIQQFVMR